MTFFDSTFLSHLVTLLILYVIHVPLTWFIEPGWRCMFCRNVWFVCVAFYYNKSNISAINIYTQGQNCCRRIGSFLSLYYVYVCFCVYYWFLMKNCWPHTWVMKKKLGYAITYLLLVQNRFSSWANRHFECCPCKALKNSCRSVVKINDGWVVLSVEMPLNWAKLRGYQYKLLNWYDNKSFNKENEIIQFLVFNPF